MRRVGRPGQGIAVTFAHWAAAILYNGLGRYDEALAAAASASADTPGCTSRCGRCPS
jgi:hypothetical protein